MEEYHHLAAVADRLSAAAHASGSMADHAAARQAHDAAMGRSAPGSAEERRHEQAGYEHHKAAMGGGKKAFPNANAKTRAAAREGSHKFAQAVGRHPGAIERHPDHAHDGPKHHEAQQRAMLHGAKGGTFYINEHGQKTYAKK